MNCEECGMMVNPLGFCGCDLALDVPDEFLHLDLEMMNAEDVAAEESGFAWDWYDQVPEFDG